MRTEDSIFAQDANDPALDFHLGGRDDDCLHLGVSWLEADLAAGLAVEALEDRFAAADQRDDDFAGIGHLGLLDHNKVAIEDVVFHHRIALHLQNEGVAPAGEITERNRLAVFDGLERLACGDAAGQRQLDCLALDHLLADRLGELHHLNRTALVVAAADETLALESRDVLVHRRQRSQLQRACDLLKARRVAVLVQEADQEIQDLFLPLGECHGALLPTAGPASLGELKAKVKSFSLAACFPRGVVLPSLRALRWAEMRDYLNTRSRRHFERHGTYVQHIERRRIRALSAQHGCGMLGNCRHTHSRVVPIFSSWRVQRGRQGGRMSSYFSWMIGGPQGSGLNVSAEILAKALARAGYYVFGQIEYHSNIKGKHSAYRLRIAAAPTHSHVETVHLLSALDEETLVGDMYHEFPAHRGHVHEIAPGGAILYDAEQKKFIDWIERDDILLWEMPYADLLDRALAEAGKPGQARVYRIMTNTLALGAS